MCVSALSDVMHINLLSFSLSELCVELRPRLCSDPSNELEPLKLSVTWSQDDRFRLQVTTCEVWSTFFKLHQRQRHLLTTHASYQNVS